MSQVLGAFGLLDFTLLWPVLAWRAFGNLGTVYVFNFPIFSGRGKQRLTETADTESAYTEVSYEVDELPYERENKSYYGKFTHIMESISQVLKHYQRSTTNMHYISSTPTPIPTTQF